MVLTLSLQPEPMEYHRTKLSAERNPLLLLLLLLPLFAVLCPMCPPALALPCDQRHDCQLNRVCLTFVACQLLTIATAAAKHLAGGDLPDSILLSRHL